jgi:hypothetical protein
MSTQYIGELEQMVLLAVLRLGDEAYGVAVTNELAERGSRGVAWCHVRNARSPRDKGSAGFAAR